MTRMNMMNLDKWTLMAGLVLVGLCSNSLAQDEAPRLAELPAWSLESMAEPVREALSQARERVDNLTDEGANEVALAEAWGRLGDVSFAHDLAPQARVAYRNAIALRPDRQEWRYLLGLVEIGEGDLDEGIAQLTHAIELYPNDHAALIRRGRAYLETGEFERAASDFQQAAGIAPRSPAVLGGLGRAGFQLGEHEAAVNLLSEALERAPEANALHQPLGMAYRALGDAERARYHLSQSGEVREPVQDPALDRVRRLSRSPQFYLETGLAQAERGNFESAERLLGRALELAPDNDNILRELGEVRARLGDFDAAREVFAELVTRSTVDAEAYFLLGQVEEQRGEFDAAIDAYRDALAIDAGHVQARESTAFALFNSGEIEAAMERFAALAEEAAEPTLQARFVYWQAIGDLAQGACEQASEKLDRARSLYPDPDREVLTALARMRASCLSVDEEALDEALEWASAMYDASPDVQTAATLAMVHAARGEFDDAVDFQAQALFEALKRHGNLESRPDLQADMERYRQQQPAERPFGPEHPVFSPGLAGG